jgi:hypothetical protein
MSDRFRLTFHFSCLTLLIHGMNAIRRTMSLPGLNANSLVATQEAAVPHPGGITYRHVDLYRTRAERTLPPGVETEKRVSARGDIQWIEPVLLSGDPIRLTINVWDPRGTPTIRKPRRGR